jgi:virulence-associated protein VapD
MSRHERLIQRILRGQSDANIRFADLRALMRHLGFDERTRGSHYLYRRRGVVEKVNLQRDGANAKPYQVRQVRRVILKYQLGGTSDSQV